MENIALFGGSFDPPHIGHVAVVDALLKRDDIEGIVIMPTYLNPFKTKSHADASLRLKWLKQIFSSYPNVIIDSYEVDLKQKVPSIQTVVHLLKKYKKIYLVIGADNLEGLERWHRYDELKELVTFLVASRSNIEVPKDFLILNVNCDVSSTELRDKVESSKLPKICANEITTYYKEIDANKN